MNTDWLALESSVVLIELQRRGKGNGRQGAVRGAPSNVKAKPRSRTRSLLGAWSKS
jgi:hypothetical protein